jgi:hypothetical protein
LIDPNRTNPSLPEPVVFNLGPGTKQFWSDDVLVIGALRTTVVDFQNGMAGFMGVEPARTQDPDPLNRRWCVRGPR